MKNPSDIVAHVHPFAFEAGWRLLNDYEKEEVKKDIMSGLQITTDQSFYMRRRGVYEPKITEEAIINAAFAKHGVKASFVWGE